jgi:UDP-N-acetylmuramoyl-tripeptide--D-alanyl-D-alanine ligase
MEVIKIDEILNVTQGTLIQGDKNLSINRISTDSRKIEKGDLFIALKGNRFDGHDFIDEVIKKGASGILISKDIVTSYQLPVTSIRVKDTLIALGKIAAYYRQKFNIPISAITGSNGKTTTKEMAWCLLSQKFNTLKCHGSFNNAVGVPLTLLELNNTTQAAVIELGMNQPGEIEYLTNIAKPQIALITNIGESHIGYLKSRENIAKEKLQILQFAKIAILNYDDEYLNKAKFDGKIITFGLHNFADITAQNLYQDIDGIKFNLKIAGKEYNLKIPILGLHNVYNILGAIAIAYALGVNFEEIQEALKKLKTPYGRMELISAKGIKIINDTYNANPTSLKAAIKTLNQIHTHGRKILVMGDMLELGNFSKSFHTAIAKEIIANKIDILFTVGDYASYTLDEACKEGVEVYKCNSNDEIVAKLKKIINKDDIILVKGSRRMKLEEVVEGIIG